MWCLLELVWLGPQSNAIVCCLLTSQEEEEKQIIIFLNYSKIQAVASQRDWGKGKIFSLKADWRILKMEIMWKIQKYESNME